MVLGRPTVYKPEMLPKIIEVMSDGGSKTEVAAVLGITRSTLYEWIESIPAFADAIKEGESLCQAWWEKAGRNGMVTKDGVSLNASVWIFNMKNRFREDWKDKHETEHTGNMSVNWPVPKSPLDD